ncbi:hypothetical protein BHE74_00055552 [Ensete ventricosum]|nr:hypothetical protein BHE74_00055552 [Ensete ventricosum]
MTGLSPSIIETPPGDRVLSWSHPENEHRPPKSTRDGDLMTSTFAKGAPTWTSNSTVEDYCPRKLLLPAVQAMHMSTGERSSLLKLSSHRRGREGRCGIPCRARQRYGKQWPTATSMLRQ